MVEPLAALTAKLISPRALYSLLAKLATSNDRAAAEAYREQLDEVALEIARRFPEWEAADPDDRPSSNDAGRAAEEFVDAFDSSSGAAKRKLLVNAFFGRFNPKF